MAGLAGRESREPVRGPSSSDPRAPSRPSGGSRASSSALAAGAGGTRANHLDFRRAGDRQVAPDRGAPGPFDRRTIFGNALLLLAASRQSALYPFAASLIRAAQFELEDSAETRRAKMKALLFQWGADPETIEVFN